MPQIRSKGKLRLLGGINVRFRPLVYIRPLRNNFWQPLSAGIKSSDLELAISRLMVEGYRESEEFGPLLFETQALEHFRDVNFYLLSIIIQMFLVISIHHF